MIYSMEESVPSQFGACSCGQPLPSAGAKRCPQCRAAHARKHIGRQARRLRKLPPIASLGEDTNWVAANLSFKRPDFASAPSRTAISLLASIKADKNLRRDFWATHFKRRLKRAYG